MNAGRIIDKERLASALSNLNRRIEAGEDFPDAAWAATCSFNVTYESLDEDYDNQQMGL